jgi:hypothetical protein
MRVLEDLFYCMVCQHLRPLRSIVVLHKMGYYRISEVYKVNQAICCNCADAIHPGVFDEAAVEYDILAK